jgi:tetratricopeptide (TPR) repeat protein
VALFNRSLAAFVILMGLWLASPAVLSTPTKPHAPATPASFEACTAPAAMLEPAGFDAAASASQTTSAVPEVAACHRLAIELASSHDYDRAIAVESRQFEREPMNAEIATALAGMQESGRKDVVQALRMYHEALYASPGYPAALLGLGSHWKGRSESLIAERYFARGARENPDQPVFQLRLAEVMMEAGRPAEAAPILQEVLARFPQSGEADDARRLLSRTSLARP